MNSAKRNSLPSITNGQVQRQRRAASFVVGVLLGIFAASSASGQAAPDFTGIWSGSLTSKDDARWGPEDHICFPGCLEPMYSMLRSRFADPALADAPLADIMAPVGALLRDAFTARLTESGLETLATHTVENDPTIYCQPYGLVREATNPAPMRIRAEGNDLVFEYEEWALSRVIHMDPEFKPGALPATPLGFSRGSYDGRDLVVETSRLTGDIYYSFISGGAYSDRATTVERYSLLEGGQKLRLLLEVSDPETLIEPIVFEKLWLATPDLMLLDDRCGDVPGEF